MYCPALYRDSVQPNKILYISPFQLHVLCAKWAKGPEER